MEVNPSCRLHIPPQCRRVSRSDCIAFSPLSTCPCWQQLAFDANTKLRHGRQLESPQRRHRCVAICWIIGLQRCSTRARSDQYLPLFLSVLLYLSRTPLGIDIHHEQQHRRNNGIVRTSEWSGGSSAHGRRGDKRQLNKKSDNSGGVHDPAADGGGGYTSPSDSGDDSSNDGYDNAETVGFAQVRRTLEQRGGG